MQGRCAEVDSDAELEIEHPRRQPPAPWRMLEHPEAPGEWYYLNEQTGDTTWDFPEGADNEDNVGCSNAEEEGEGGRPPTPPSPWKLEEHPDAPGEWYYLNEDTGETTWELLDDVNDQCAGGGDDKEMGSADADCEAAPTAGVDSGLDIDGLIGEAAAAAARENTRGDG